MIPDEATAFAITCAVRAFAAATRPWASGDRAGRIAIGSGPWRQPRPLRRQSTSPFCPPTHDWRQCPAYRCQRNHVDDPTATRCRRDTMAHWGMRSVLRGIAVLAVLTVCREAHATPGFDVERFDPSERGSTWFAADSLDLRGSSRSPIGLVLGWEKKPLVVTDQGGSTRTAIVRDVVTLHIGRAWILRDRFRLAVDVPFVPYTQGHPADLRGVHFDPPDHDQTIGDLRFSADARVFGRYGDAATGALGFALALPTGWPGDYTSDGSVRFTPRALVAGKAGMFAWAGKLGVALRDTDAPELGGASIGSELVFAAAAGVRLAGDRLTVGPELLGGTVLKHDAFKVRTSPVEALLGAHFDVHSGIRVGAGAGTGVIAGYGSPAFRLLASLEWVPPYVEPRPPPPPPPPRVDTDGDGIPDDEDACMDSQGPRSSDPRTSGCGDRDGDGIVDPLDACPDVPGVASPDPKKNGCPGDRDGDGIDDPQRACPDVKGVATDDPKTNGCPPDPDRDKDGIPNESDACPDEAGPADPIPARNGCPFAFARKGQILLRQQPEFLGVTSKLLLAQSEPVLNGILAYLTEHDEIERVRVEGHTDNRGDGAANQKLSEARAQAVVDWLVAHGIDKGKLTVVGRGMDKPIDSNDTDEGRARNRRIELWIETSHP